MPRTATDPRRDVGDTAFGEYSGQLLYDRQQGRPPDSRDGVVRLARRGSAVRGRRHREKSKREQAFPVSEPPPD
jgi:hypothetical protein